MHAAPTKSPKPKPKNKEITRRMLCRATLTGHWWEIESILRNDPDAVLKDEINDDGETIIHVAVGTRHKYFVKKLFDFINDIDDGAEEILGKTSLDGSTALHIAASTGNTYAAGLLIQKMNSLLDVADCEGSSPVFVALQNHHYETSLFLLKASPLDRVDLLSEGYVLLHGVVSAKRYDLAFDLLDTYPSVAMQNVAAILDLITENFPNGLKGYWETLLYPSSMGDIRERIVYETSWLFTTLAIFNSGAIIKPIKGVLSGTIMMFLVPVLMLLMVYQLVRYLIFLVYFSVLMLYILLWKVTTKLVPLISNIEKKKKEWENAKIFLKLVFDKLEEAGLQSKYNILILEAACQNVYEVVEEILSRSPDAIRYTDKDEHGIIHFAIISRSENIFNIIYKIRGRSTLYMQDRLWNNILHTVGRLAPLSKLKRRTGAALQMQLELQWREEVKKLLASYYITQKNIFGETPDMVFTREHENLLNEGEKWMKTTAESCSITAALITTIVFAAAITVPGGSNQESGIPIFTKEVAFITFAVADTISLCASTVSLLMFVSILTARFSEQDFLKKLPRQLFIGLCSLLISTIAMMVAFGMTVFLVFCHHKAWMLAPIGGLVFLPITIFVVLQVPLMVDLFMSTYVSIFSKKHSERTDWFHPDHILMFVDKLNERWSNQRQPQRLPSQASTPKAPAHIVETEQTSASPDAISAQANAHSTT